VALLAGAVAVFAGIGVPDAAVLSASQLAGALPDAVIRLTVGAGLVGILPVGVAILQSRQSQRERRAGPLDEEITASVHGR
jgi:hypothetical protein